jgi:archaellum component FlaC
MSSIYDYGYYDDVPFIPKKCCDGGSGGRSEEQKEIDDAQDKAIEQEIERSKGIDDTQTQEIADINEKIKGLNNEWHDI